VKFFEATLRGRSRFPLAIIAGLLLAAAFPKIGIAGFAWIAPGLMIAAALGTRGWQSFRIGYVAGLVHYLASLYWLLLIPYQWHGIPIGPGAGWMALSAFLALFPATWVWLAAGDRNPKSESQKPKQPPDSKSESKGPEAKEQTENSKTAAPPSTDYRPLTTDSTGFTIFASSWSRRTLWSLSGAAVWVGLEMIVARIFGGFPWNLLGDSQYQMTPLIQIASVTGVYGVSFLIIWTSLSLLSAALRLIRAPAMRSVWLAEVFLPILTVAVLFAFGSRRVLHKSISEQTLKVAFVQPSIPQTLIWDESNDDERFHDLLQLSEQALTNKVDLLLWPEAAVPKKVRWNKETYEAVTGLAREHHVWMIIGADDMELRLGAKTDADIDYYNSSFLINPEGRIVRGYRKRALVIFGEYIPLEHALPFIKWVTPVQGSFTPGDRAVPFELEGLRAKTSVLICFEDTFAHLAREYVQPDTDFLVNLTNNGWFGEGAAQWQHAAAALFRAVENGRPLLRCSNNGLTCWVDEHGRIQEIFHDSKDRIYGPGYMLAEIPLLAHGQPQPTTFYNQHGDVFGWACLCVAGFMVLRRVADLRKKKSRP
jgi:apolipoprotein N-acyltransferase